MHQSLNVFRKQSCVKSISFERAPKEKCPLQREEKGTLSVNPCIRSFVRLEPTEFLKTQLTNKIPKKSSPAAI